LISIASASASSRFAGRWACRCPPTITAARGSARSLEDERLLARIRQTHKANQALDEVRRAYWNELRSLGDQEAAKRFKDSRWSLLKKPEKLTDEQAAILSRIKAAGGEVWRAYELKEAVRGIFQPGLSPEDVEVLIDRLLSRLARSRLDPFVRLGNTIRKHPDGILAAIRLRINQGRTEALNNKVRLITRRAYGFHSVKAALALVLLTCGPINLHLPHELHALGLG
jgi:transposase